MILLGKYALGAIFFTIAAVSFSQPEQIYSDPVLLNGKIYVFHLPPDTEGHQFLAQREFTPGRLKLKDVEYNDVLLNYDIYNQQLLLRYTGSSGSSNQIVVSDAWIKEFTIENREFKPMIFGDSIKRFYQVIGQGRYEVLCSYRKNLELSHFHGAANRIFSGTLRTMYLMHDGRRTEYRNNRSFLKIFEKEKRNRIREFIRQKRINVKKADDAAIASLISYINNIE